MEKNIAGNHRSLDNFNQQQQQHARFKDTKSMSIVSLYIRMRALNESDLNKLKFKLLFRVTPKRKWATVEAGPVTDTKTMSAFRLLT